MLPQKKTNSNCRTPETEGRRWPVTALSVVSAVAKSARPSVCRLYNVHASLRPILLFSDSCYLYNPSAAFRARYWRSACIDTDMLRLVAAACCDRG